MSHWDLALLEFKQEVIEEVERRIWARLEPRLRHELYTRYLSVKETSAYLGVSQSTVRKLLGEKTLPSFRVRNQIFIRLQDIDDWIESQVKESPTGRLNQSGRRMRRESFGRAEPDRPD